jgi:cytochrome c biogenesis protein CcdA
MALFLFAVAAGFLTVLAPCILPILPIILGAGSQASRARPLFVVLGFVLSFSLIGAAFATAGSVLGVSQETLRVFAVVLLTLFGLSMVFEATYQRLTAGVSGMLNRLGGKISVGSAGKSSAWSGLPVGVSLGLVWTPCAGAILGTILTLAATQRDFATTAVLFAAYSVGAGLPMLGIAYGGGWITQRLRKIGAKAETLNTVFGVLVLAAALAIAFGFDRVIQAFLVQFYPSGILPL